MSANPAAESAPLNAPASGGVNPNVNTNEQLTESSEPQEKVSGDVTSFEELEQLHSHVGKGAPRRKPAPPKPKVSDIEVDKDGDAALNAENLTPKQQAKIRKFLAGEKEFDLPEDATAVQTVDGEEVEVKLSDLFSNYSGKTSWDKKFTELDTERRTFEKQQDQIQNDLNNIHKRFVDEKDPEAAIKYIGRAMGLKPAEITQLFKEYKTNLWTQMKELDEEGLGRLLTEDENAFLKQEFETGQQNVTKQKELEEIEKRTDTVIAKYKEDGLDFNKMTELYEELKGDYPDVTPEEIGEVYKDRSDIQMVSDAIDLSGVELSNDDKDFALRKISKMVIDDRGTDTWSKDDIESILKGLVVSKAETKITKKITKGKPAPKKSEPKTEKVDIPISFDDLE